MQFEKYSSDGEEGIDIPSLKILLNEAVLESVKIVSGQIVETPIIAKRVDISGGNIRAMILARTINISDSNAVIEKGGKLFCARIFHDCSHSVKGGEILAGREFYKVGKVCCNYSSGNSCEELMILGED